MFKRALVGIVHDVICVSLIMLALALIGHPFGWMSAFSAIVFCWAVKVAAVAAFRQQVR